MTEEPVVYDGEPIEPTGSQVHDEDSRYILIDTDILDKFSAKDMTPTTFTVYAALKAFANERGQCFPSNARLAERAHCSLSAVKASIAKLVELKLVAKQARLRPENGQTSNLYIIRRSRHAPQPPGGYPQPSGSTPPGHQEAPPQSSGDHEEQSINYNHMKNKLTPPTPQGGRGRVKEHPHLEQWFTDFWTLYPRKIEKPVARKAYAKVVTSQEEADAVLAGLRQWVTSEEWRKDGGQFIPYPSRFLNSRRFEDAPAAITLPTSRSTPGKSLARQRLEELRGRG